MKVFVKIQKIFFLEGGGGQVEGVRVDVNEELKFLCKFKKKKIYIYFFFFGGGGGGGGSGREGGSGWGGGGGGSGQM